MSKTKYMIRCENCQEETYVSLIIKLDGIISCPKCESKMVKVYQYKYSERGEIEIDLIYKGKYDSPQKMFNPNEFFNKDNDFLNNINEEQKYKIIKNNKTNIANNDFEFISSMEHSIALSGNNFTWHSIEKIKDVKYRLEFRKYFLLAGGKIPKREVKL